MEFKLVSVGYIMSGSCALLAQVPGDPVQFASWLQYGALGILGFTTLGLFYVILQLVAGYKVLSDAADKRQGQLHSDSEALNETLARLRENCATVNAKK